MAANEDFRAARSAQDPYVDEPEEEELFDDEQPPKRASRVLPIVVASLAILGFVVIVYYAYQQGIRAGSEQNPPILKAEEGPTRVRPASPGGMEVPNQGMKVYELGKPGAQTAAPGPERILPKAEEPLQRPKEPPPAPMATMTQPAAPPAPAASAPPLALPSGATTGSAAGLVPSIPGSAAASANALPGGLPPLSMATGTPLSGSSAVNTPPPPPLPGAGQPAAPSLGATADTPPVAGSTKVAGPSVPAPPPPAAPPRDNSPPPAAAAQAPSTRSGIALGNARPGAPVQQQQAATPTPAPAPAPQAASPQPSVPPIAGTPASGGSHRVQIVAAKSEPEAQQAWQAAQKKYGDLLGGLKMETQPIEVPNKGTMIRVLVGPLASKPEADKLCADLKARKQDCIVR